MKLLRVFAVLFGLLAVSNLTKVFELQHDHGFVFLGRRLDGTPNAMAGVSFGVFLALYARALWYEYGYALAMGFAYAVYVTGNMALFTMRSPELAASSALFGVTYVVIAAGSAWGAVVAMRREGIGDDTAQYENVLRIFAILFALMALSNFLKPTVYAETTGFVLFGQRLTGTANAVVAPIFATFLAVYAYSIWQQRRWAVPMGMVYAAYVVSNLVLWNFRKPDGADTGLLFGLGYLAIALGVSCGSAYLLTRVRDRLV